MALCSERPMPRWGAPWRHVGSAVDLASRADSGGYVRVPLRRRGSLVVWFVLCCLFVRISAAHCVCVLSDGGRHGASAVSLMAQGDSVGYISVPCRRRGSMVALLLFCCLFMRISAA